MKTIQKIQCALKNVLSARYTIYPLFGLLGLVLIQVRTVNAHAGPVQISNGDVHVWEWRDVIDHEDLAELESMELANPNLDLGLTDKITDPVPCWWEDTPFFITSVEAGAIFSVLDVDIHASVTSINLSCLGLSGGGDAGHLTFGCDDFDDNSLDSSRWTLSPFSKPGHQFSESGGHLTYSSTSGVDGWCALDWTEDALSWNESWFFEVDVHSGAGVENLVFGLSLEDSSTAFSLKYIDSGNGYFYFNTVAFDVNTDAAYYDQDFSAPLTNATIRISFDANTKVITTSYSTGSSYTVLASTSTIGWGWGETTTFSPTLFVDNHNDPVSAGGLYAENFLVVIEEPDLPSVSDTFSDGNIDTNEWVENIYGNDPGAVLLETGGQLVYTNAGTDGLEGWAASKWQLDTLRFDRDWTCELDVGLNVESDIQLGAGFELYADSTAFQMEFNQVNTNSYWVELDVFDIPSDSGLLSTNITLYGISGPVTLRLSFNASSMEMLASYDLGGETIPLLCFDATEWGLTEDACLTPMVFVDNYGQPIVSGQVLLDNFALYGDIIENFQGSDDFNDNAVDVAKWTLPEQGLGTMNEVNGRLEYAGHSRESGAFWIANSSSYTRDWAVVCDAHNAENSRIAGMYVSFGPSNSWINIEHHRNADVTNQHLVMCGFSLTDDDEADVYQFAVAITNDTIQLGLAYDAASKTVYGAYDAGEGFVLVTNYNISALEIDACDTFSLGLYAGTESSTAVTPGALYFDNFSAVPNRGFLAQDIDNDGLDLWSEHIAGTDALSGDSVFKIGSAVSVPVGHVLSWPAIQGRTYTVEWTDHLTNSFQTLETDIAYPQNSYTDTTHNAESGGFYNLNVRLINKF